MTAITATVDEVIVLFEALVERTEQQLLAGAIEGAQLVEDNAKATTSYGNVTGATRASTMAVAYRAEDYPPGAYDESRAVAEGLNPGHGGVDNLLPPPAPDSIVIDCFASTDYSLWLQLRGAGASMFTADAIQQEAGSVFDTTVAATGGLFT